MLKSQINILSVLYNDRCKNLTVLEFLDGGNRVCVVEIRAANKPINDH